MKIEDTLITPNKNIMLITLGTGLILVVPLIAMQFSDEVRWGLADFIIVGCLLFGTGLMYEFLARRVSTTRHRVILGIVLLVAFFLVWAELAVGIFGTPFSGS
jgi:hypothetical protein